MEAKLGKIWGKIEAELRQNWSKIEAKLKQNQGKIKAKIFKICPREPSYCLNTIE